MSNIETIIIKYINDYVDGIDAYGDVPSAGEKPEKFVTVELSGGSETKYIGDPVVSIQCWAATREDAANLASIIKDAMWEAPALVNEIMSVGSPTISNFPSADGEPRYQLVYYPTVCY